MHQMKTLNENENKKNKETIKAVNCDASSFLAIVTIIKGKKRQTQQQQRQREDKIKSTKRNSARMCNDNGEMDYGYCCYSLVCVIVFL